VGAKEDTFKVLGDDIVIRDSKLAIQYHEILDTLGVPVSKAKTMASKTTFEFAKRWFHKGIEVSPFPVSALHENLTFPPGLVETFRTALDKGWYTNTSFVGPGLVKNILKLHDINQAFARKIVFNYSLFASFPRASDTDQTREEKSVRFLSLVDEQVSCVG